MNKTNIVLCNGCTVCCQKDLIFLKPHLGDIPENYKCDLINNKWVLKHKKNSDCIYLDRSSGCTIYKNRPIVCKGLDCRFVLDLPRLTRKQLISKGLIRKEFVKAARELRKRSEKSINKTTKV